MLKDCKTKYSKEEYVTKNVYGLQTLTYFLSGPLQRESLLTPSLESLPCYFTLLDW